MYDVSESQISLFDDQTGFLGKFADGGLGDWFPRCDLAHWEIPHPLGELCVRAALKQGNPVCLLGMHDHRGDQQGHRFCCWP